MAAWKIQNKVTICAVEHVRRKIQASLSKSSYFSLIADKVTDHAKKKFS